MLSSKFLKVVKLVAFHWILVVVPIKGQLSRWPSHSSHQDFVSVSEINRALDDIDERRRLSLSVDQAIWTRPHQVPSCQAHGHIYDARAKVCSRAGTKAHCGDNMIFLAVPNTEGLGSCACANANSVQCWGRPQVLAGHYRCYDIAKRGPCKAGETMVPISKFHAKCSPDACLYSKPENAYNLPDESKRNPWDSPIFNFAYKGKCYSTETQAFCPRGQIVRFVMPYKIPVCTNRNAGNCLTLGQGASLQIGSIPDCQPGFVAHPVTRSCQPESLFDF